MDNVPAHGFFLSVICWYFSNQLTWPWGAGDGWRLEALQGRAEGVLAPHRVPLHTWRAFRDSFHVDVLIYWYTTSSDITQPFSLKYAKRSGSTVIYHLLGTLMCEARVCTPNVCLIYTDFAQVPLYTYTNLHVPRGVEVLGRPLVPAPHCPSLAAADLSEHNVYP